LSWGLPAVAREVRLWKGRARAIPDEPLREDALDALKRKRAHTDGAALFSILPERRDGRLLALLVAYEIMADFLDNVSERGAKTGQEDGLRINLALVEAIDPGEAISDHYRHYRWRDDGDYLIALVRACLMWFESSAAASGWLTVLALLAVAAEPACEGTCVADTYAAYFPWTSLAGTMLDSYVDVVEDTCNADHSYIAHYPNNRVAVQRTRWAIERSARAVGSLRGGHRHAIIAACMVAMYSSKDSALAPVRRSTTHSLVRAGGSLTMLMLPVLRLWRTVYALRSA
jgi:tetraprenyl-beta-curcumene synthase